MLQFIAINTNQEHWTKSPAIISRKKNQKSSKINFKNMAKTLTQHSICNDLDCNLEKYVQIK